MNAALKQIYQGVLEGDIDMVTTGVQVALDEKVTAEAILKQSMMAAMAEVGQLFEDGEYFIPELLIAARAMQGGGEGRSARHWKESSWNDDGGSGF
jgi:5-methyltetrahydrofolate--homocysteine methyltransferase